MKQNDIRNDLNGETVAVVVMAKSPVAGRVKTRLGPEYTGMQSAEIHCAMVNCVLSRLSGLAAKRCNLGLYLALDDIGCNNQEGLEIECPGEWQVIEQGSGDLGERLGRVWAEVGGGSAVFFGGDSPDFPIAGVIDAIEVIAGGGDVALGGSDDGGYWLVGGRKFYPQLFSGIDWGSERVYHQTIEGAAGLGVFDPGVWYDVDTPEDLAELRVRLRDVFDDELITLGSALDRICKG